jgi:hypothetical protein
VSSALTQVEKELKQAGLAQQKPATEALNQAADTAKAMIHEMRREMSRYTWKSAIYLVLTIFFVLASCVTAFTWFMNDGYSQIAEMQRWKRSGRRKPRWLTYRAVTESPALRWTLALRMVIKRIPG